MPSNFTFTVESEPSYCVSLYIIEDLLAEAREQFELYFASNYTGIGDNATVCVSIENNDGTTISLDYVYWPPLGFSLLYRGRGNLEIKLTICNRSMASHCSIASWV